MENEEKVEAEVKPKKQKTYKTGDKLSTPLAFLFGFQHIASCMGPMLSVPIIISSEVCAGSAIYVVRMKLISSTLIISGITTVMQTLLGLRLAVLQGPGFSYLPALHIFLSMQGYPCKTTENDYVPNAEYDGKVATIQGCLILAALVPFFAGCTGAIGLTKKYIGPLTVSPLLLLLVYSALDMCVERMAKHWVAFIQAATIFVMLFYLSNWKVPFIIRKKGHWTVVRSRVFKLYPYLIALLAAWAFCLFLTLTNLTSQQSSVRLDKNETLAAIYYAKWFQVPYPGQFGNFKFHTGLFISLALSAFVTFIESVGCYYAAARTAEETSPPSHAINRGVTIEALGTFLGGLLGSASGVTIYSLNIGVMGVTKVAARASMVAAGVLLIFLGIFSKTGAIFATIPDPLIGAILASSMAMVLGISIATLQQVDIKCTRNIAIIGWSLLVGMVVPKYFISNPPKTGNDSLDQALLGLLTLPMFVGPFIGFLLDNTVPGATREQRGFRDQGSESANGRQEDEVYNLQKRISIFIDKVPHLRSLPFFPKRQTPKSVSPTP